MSSVVIHVGLVRDPEIANRRTTVALSLSHNIELYNCKMCVVPVIQVSLLIMLVKLHLLSVLKRLQEGFRRV